MTKLHAYPRSFPEKIRIRLDMVWSEIRIFPLRLLSGFKQLRGPLFTHFGSGLAVTIRGRGTLSFGKISARRNLSLLCVGGHITIADNVFINQGCTFNAMNRITIGEGTLFGENVKVYDCNHAMNADGSPSPDMYETSPVTIGARCWIGSNVVILKGVTLCDQVVIGANAVVAKSIDIPGVYVLEGASRLKRIHQVVKQ